MRALVLAAALVLGASAARADDAEEAKKQHELGTQAYSARRFPEAARAFEASAALRPNAVTLYTAGLAWEQASQPDRAADAFARALDLPGLLPQQELNAKERLAALERALGTLVVTGEARVRVDGRSELPTPARIHATPGLHVLTARFADGALDRRDVELEPGQTLDLEVKPPEKSAPIPRPAPPIELPTPAPRTSAPSPLAFLGAGALGAGVAFGLASIVVGASSLEAKDPRDASALAPWAHAAWITGAALALTGVILLVVPRGDTRVALGPSGVRVAF